MRVRESEKERKRERKREKGEGSKCEVKEIGEGHLYVQHLAQRMVA